MPMTPITKGIFGADRSFRTSRIRCPSNSAYRSYPPGFIRSGYVQSETRSLNPWNQTNPANS